MSRSCSGSETRGGAGGRGRVFPVGYATARSERDEFRTPGVYVLAGASEDPKFEARVYVGEADDPRSRLDNHSANKDFWNRVVLFTSVGQSLNKATVRYLEARLLQLASAAGRALLDNGNAPSLPPLSEPDRVDAGSFLGDMLVIYPLLGLNVSEPVESLLPTALRLYLNGPEASAEGAQAEDGFVVFAGATARTAMVDSMPDWAAGIRQALVQLGVFVPDVNPARLRLTQDHVFNSPSAAAAVLLGRSAAGPVEWKDASEETLKSLREKAIL